MYASASQQQWSVEVPNTSRPPNHPSGGGGGGRGNIRRSYDPLASPTLGALGVRTLYEALRRGCDINPLGPCLGYRATRYERIYIIGILLLLLDMRYDGMNSFFFVHSHFFVLTFSLLTLFGYIAYITYRLAATVALPHPTCMGATANASHV